MESPDPGEIVSRAIRPDLPLHATVDLVRAAQMSAEELSKLPETDLERLFATQYRSRTNTNHKR